MAAAKFAWGIDIGNRALKAVKLVPDGDAFVIDDFEVIEHEQVLSTSGDNRDSLIQQSIAQFVAKHATKGGIVGVGVSGQQSFARFIKPPPVEEKKLPDIVRFEAVQQIPFPLDEVEWAYQILREEGSPDVEIGIFAMKKELVNKHVGFFTSVDLNVQLVQTNPLALYNALQHDNRIKGTTMIIDLGAENTDLIIADGSRIWMRSIPIAGNNFTEALAKSFKLDFKKAEELERTTSTSKYQRQIFQAMRPVFADLVSEIQRSIGFYSSVHRDSRIERVIAAGGTFRLPALQKYLQQNLQLDVELVETLGNGAPGDGKSAAAFGENVLSMVSAYGLAVQALGPTVTRVTSSLLPGEIRRAKMWKDKTRIFLAAAALFAVGAAVPFVSIYIHGASLESAKAEHTADINKTISEAEQRKALWSQIGSAEQDRQTVINMSRLYENRKLVNHVMTSMLLHFTPDRAPTTQGPRSARQQFVIQQMWSIYVPDMTPIINATDDVVFVNIVNGQPGGAPTPAFSPSGPIGNPDSGGSQDGGSRGFTPPSSMAPVHNSGDGSNTNTAALTGRVPRGYIIRIKGRTTYKDAETLLKQLIDRKILPQNAKWAEGVKSGYFVVRAAQVSTPTKPKFPAPTSAGTGPGGATVDANDPSIDPVTGESMKDDYEFDIAIAVRVDPPAYVPQPPPQ